jgi:hypothetical protein
MLYPYVCRERDYQTSIESAASFARALAAGAAGEMSWGRGRHVVEVEREKNENKNKLPQH